MVRNKIFFFCMVILLLIWKSQASPEIGFSARLRSNVNVPGSALTVINEWESRFPHLFEYGIKLVTGQAGGIGKERTILPFGGLFLVSANLMIEAEYEIEKLKICITNDVCQETGQNEHTVTVAIQNYFPKNEIISLKLYADKTFTVLKDSSFALQFLGPISRMAGFLAVLTKNQSINFGKDSSFVPVYGWVKKGKSENESNSKQTRVDSTANIGNLSVQCPGMYLVSMTLSFYASKNIIYEIRILSNKTEITYKKHCRFDGIATITVLKNFDIPKDGKITVQIRAMSSKRVRILKGSRFSAVFIGKSGSEFAEFVEPLKEEKYDGGIDQHILSSYIPKNVIQQKEIKETNQDKYQIGMPRHGVYVITLHLNIKISTFDKLTAEIRVYEKGLKAFTSLYSRKTTDFCSSASKEYKETSLVLTGVLALETHDFITIALKSACKDAFMILKGSWISFMAARSHDFAASFLIRGQPVKNELIPPVPDLVLNMTSSRVFPLNVMLSLDQKEFKCPFNGLYFINMNLVVSGRKSMLKTANIQVLKRNADHNVDRALYINRSVIFDVNVTIFDGLTAITPSFVHNLKENDILSFRVFSNSKLEIRNQSSLFISLTDFVETGRTFVGEHKKNEVPIIWDKKEPFIMTSWVPKIPGFVGFSSQGARRAPKTGEYLVTCFAELVLRSNVSIDNLRLSLLVYFDGKSAEFGLKDSSEVIKSGNGTINFYLSVSGVLEGKKDSNLVTLLVSNQYDVNITISSSQLSVSLHSASEEGPEMYRALLSSPKLLTFKKNNWVPLDRRIYLNNDGEFKSNSVEFLGNRIQAQRSILAFVAATTVLHGVDGTVEYGVVVAPGSELKSNFTITTEVNGKSLKTLKWVGFVYMTPWQQLGLVVRMVGSGTNEGSSRLSWSSLSFMALSFPDTADQVQFLKGSSNAAPSDGWFITVQHMQPTGMPVGRLPSSPSGANSVMALQNMNKGDEFRNQTMSALSLPKFKVAKEQRLKKDVITYNVSILYLDDVFSAVTSLKDYTKGIATATCVVGILKVMLVIRTTLDNVISLEYHTRENNTTLSVINATQSSRNILQFNGILCLNSLHSIVLKSSFVVNLTVLKDSLFSFALTDYPKNIEGFSVIQTSNHFMLLEKCGRDLLRPKSTRLDNWIVGNLGFDSSRGFKMPFGSYIAQTSGMYLATANIILKTKLNSNITIAFYKNDQRTPISLAYRPVSKSLIYTINLAALIDFDKWDIVELKIFSNQSTSMTIFAGSSFSVIQLDQDMAFQQCQSNPFQLTISDENAIAKRIDTDVIIHCGTKTSRVVDFYWLRNDKIVRTIHSSINGTLIIKSASYNDSGNYVCRMQTGDYSVTSHGINVIVFDPAPKFSLTNQTLYVPENSPSHQVLAEVFVKAATPLETEDALVHLTVAPENMRKIFYFSPEKTKTAATLKSRMQFDYEARNHFDITIVATNLEFSGIARNSTILHVKITDRNDNPPEFEKISYSVSILENATVGTTVIALKAYDNDTGVNAEIRYFLHENLDSRLFRIGTHDGIITTRSNLDIKRSRSLTIFVIAKSGLFSTFTEVVVNIIDINDNRPYFEPSFYDVNVTETTAVGSIVSKIVAHDLDIEPKNRNVVYRLKRVEGAIPFAVDEFGKIRITQKLEKYAGKVFTVKALAYDGHGLESSNEATIVFRVIKTIIVSSFSSGLRFVTNVYRTKVRENVPVGTLVTTVKAYNPDNAYSSIRYIFVTAAHSHNFTVSENTGEVRTSSHLDYEVQKQYSLTVFACDVNGIGDCTATRVDIEVQDVNDNSPEFSQVIYRVDVNESAKVGSRVVKIIATDADSGTFGSIQYTLDKSANMFPFSIGKVDGVVKVAGDLKTINQRSVIFAVRASDKGGNIKEALVDMTILTNSPVKSTIREGKKPKFLKTLYSIFIEENAVVGRKLADIAASTQEKAIIKYSLCADENNRFKTDPARGGLYLRNQLDYEKEKKFEMFLIAEANNDARLRSYARIRVNVIDVNDNRPLLLEKSHVAYLKGSLKPGRLVTKIEAIDMDSGLSSEIVYSINTNSTVKEFLLDPKSGDLKVKDIGDEKKYVLPVIACDKGTPILCDHGIVTIHVSKDAFEGGIESTLIGSNYTFIELEFNIEKYISDGYEEIRFIAQEVHLGHPYYYQYTQLPPVTWYDVYYKRKQGNNYLRRYVAAEKSVSFKRGRARREMQSDKKKVVRFKYGGEEDCGEVWKANKICNGPLNPGTQYRFQLEFRHKGSAAFLKTGFTKPYKTELVMIKPLPISTKQASYNFPYWVAFIAVCSVLLLLLLISFICCFCQWLKQRRRKRNRYEVAIQKDSMQSLDEHPTAWKTETESQELTIWFSEESICNGSIRHSNSSTTVSRL